MSIMDVDGHDLLAVVIRWWLVVMSGYPGVLSGKRPGFGMGNPKMVLMCVVQLLRIQMISQNDVKFDVNMFEQTIFLVSCDMNLIHAITTGWHAWILHYNSLCVGSFRVKNLYGQGL